MCWEWGFARVVVVEHVGMFIDDFVKIGDIVEFNRIACLGDVNSSFMML